MTEKIYNLKIIPNSKINKIIDFRDDYLKIKLCAPAHEGKANAALMVFLGDYFQVPKKNIRLIKGEKSRQKTIKVIS